MSKTHQAKVNLFTVIYFLSVCMVGVFHEFLSCVFSAALIIGLFLYSKKESEVTIYINISSISIGLICAAYLITSFWAVDAGMAFVGFFKYIPVLIFLIVVMQKRQTVEQIHEYLPYVAVFMAVVSLVFMQIPALNETFSVAGRLAGFFQYPNTFALLLLVSELLLIRKENIRRKDLLLIIILLGGIILTGSRTVFALAVLSNAVMVFTGVSRKNRKRIIITSAAAVAVIVAVLLAAGENYIVERFLKFSLSESTFAGRLLYFQDALPVIFQHPFGLGYMGHYYLQQSIQTGLYSVRFVHNDFLQFALDIGWIPCLVFLAAVVKSLFSRGTAAYKKVILATMALHCCFDFDLQFISIFCLMITFMGYEEGKKVVLGKSKIVMNAVLTVIAATSIYMGMALFCSYINQVEISQKMYPWNTQNEIKMILLSDDINEQEEIADHIIARNEYVVLSQSIKARSAYLSGDFGEMIKWKRNILIIAPFEYAEYEEYCYMLINGIKLYSEAGDMNSAGICARELVAVGKTLDSIDSKISDLGGKIKDQPETELPEDIRQYIEQLEVLQQ